MSKTGNRILGWVLFVCFVVLAGSVLVSVITYSPPEPHPMRYTVYSAHSKNYYELLNKGTLVVVSDLEIGENTSNNGSSEDPVVVSFVGKDSGGYFVLLNPNVSFRDDYLHGQGVVEPTKVYLGESVPWYSFASADNPSSVSYEMGSIVLIWLGAGFDGSQSVSFVILYNFEKEGCHAASDCY